MSTVIFTQTDNGSEVVQIEGKIVYGTDFFIKRLNHYILSIVDGSEAVYDSGPSKIFGTILMKDISTGDRENFLSWLEDDIIFAKNRFTIGAISGVNWGLGDNTAITNCRFTDVTAEGIFEFMPPGKHTFTFNYMAVKT